MPDTMQDSLNRLRLLLKGEEAADEALLAELLRQGEEIICAYIGWQELPAPLESARLRLAVIMYNRLGTEGESIRREGNALMHFSELPRTIEMQLKPYRLGRIP
ncbi:MAG: hypothetical protein GX674_07450 [Clostridiales bacterium]|nr:hypothetical protein [Clostridiales bacterium]